MSDCGARIFRPRSWPGSATGRPARSVAVTRRLVEENKVFALAAPVGTAQSVAVIPYAKEVGLPMIGPIGGATALWSEYQPNPTLNSPLVEQTAPLEGKESRFGTTASVLGYQNRNKLWCWRP